MLNPMEVKKTNIWEYAQNKPSLIAEDLKKYGVEPEVTHKILLARGVYKWLGVRRRIIKLKNVWRDRITNTLTSIRELKKSKDGEKLAWYRGYLKAYEECRSEVRELCHSERWQSPDFDKKACEYLEKFSA